MGDMGANKYSIKEHITLVKCFFSSMMILYDIFWCDGHIFKWELYPDGLVARLFPGEVRSKVKNWKNFKAKCKAWDSRRNWDLPFFRCLRSEEFFAGWKKRQKGRENLWEGNVPNPEMFLLIFSQGGAQSVSSFKDQVGAIWWLTVVASCRTPVFSTAFFVEFRCHIWSVRTVFGWVDSQWDEKNRSDKKPERLRSTSRFPKSMRVPRSSVMFTLFHGLWWWICRKCWIILVKC